jgi:membrane protein implicated in regulation of membrane protease activity
VRFLRENSLSLVFGGLFLLAVAGQSVAGVLARNEEAAAHGGEAISWARYLVSSEFGAALVENWQSEYLQFALFVLATAWLVQRGSAESIAPGDESRMDDRGQLVGRYARSDSPAAAKAGGWKAALYGNSLLLLMAALFLASMLVQSLTARSEYNHDRAEHGEPAVSWTTYVVGADFWERALQNWQSEFLAVGSLAVFSIFLRQRGSTESKPVGAPHDQTGD